MFVFQWTGERGDSAAPKASCSVARAPPPRHHGEGVATRDGPRWSLSLCPTRRHASAATPVHTTREMDGETQQGLVRSVLGQLYTLCGSTPRLCQSSDMALPSWHSHCCCFSAQARHPTDPSWCSKSGPAKRCGAGLAHPSLGSPAAQFHGQRHIKKPRGHQDLCGSGPIITKVSGREQLVINPSNTPSSALWESWRSSKAVIPQRSRPHRYNQLEERAFIFNLFLWCCFNLQTVILGGAAHLLTFPSAQP